MDDRTDLTLDAMFARDDDKGLMLNHHRRHRDDARQSALQTVFERLPDSATRILERFAAYEPVDGGRKEDWDFLERHERVFGKAAGTRIHKKLDPWAYVYGECCDCCGRDLNPITSVKAYCVCVECNRELDKNMTIYEVEE